MKSKRIHSILFSSTSLILTVLMTTMSLDVGRAQVVYETATDVVVPVATDSPEAFRLLSVEAANDPSNWPSKWTQHPDTVVQCVVAGLVIGTGVYVWIKLRNFCKKHLSDPTNSVPTNAIVTNTNKFPTNPPVRPRSSDLAVSHVAFPDKAYFGADQENTGEKSCFIEYVILSDNRRTPYIRSCRVSANVDTVTYSNQLQSSFGLVITNSRINEYVINGQTVSTNESVWYAAGVLSVVPEGSHPNLVQLQRLKLGDPTWTTILTIMSGDEQVINVTDDDWSPSAMYRVVRVE